MQTIIVALLVFCIVVFIHELGHFAVAKFVGIKVHEFSIGMGPKLFGKKKNETEYSLRAIPLGGYVRMEGEDEESDDEASFGNKPVISRMAVILAGAFMNFVLAIVVFLIYFMIMGSPIDSNIIGDVLPNEPAQIAGVRPGDEIVRIDGKNIDDWQDISKTITEGKNSVDVQVKRGNEIKDLNIDIKEDNGKKIIGIVKQVDKSFTKAVSSSGMMFKDMIKAMFEFLGRLFTGGVSSSEVSGPVGVIYVVGEAAKSGFANVLLITGFISVNLGFFNLLPIPALDGSRFAFLLIEAIRGKKLDPNKEALVHVFGFILLISITIFITYKDILKFVIK
ncbi:MAG: RIP metalloprotease RseP [Andreesenia angusta]|nr:RIP metalloprotease RseP [Andreesenia angusta]